MNSTPDRAQSHAPSSVLGVLVRTILLAAACGLSLTGCPSRSRAPVDAAALARTQPPLEWRVNHARVTHHLGTSSLESRDAMPGHQFVVLDVSVRNRDAQPQVLSEGKLIALDEATLQTFDQPETLLSDDYLSLQVLAPAQSLHGKIAYEVPEPLTGVLYWSPGNGSERILLNPTAAPASQTTLADAAGEADAGDGTTDTRIAPGDAPLVADADPPVLSRPHVSPPARPATPTLPAKPARRVVMAPLPEPPQVVIDAPLHSSIVAPIKRDPALALTRVEEPSRQSSTMSVSPPAPRIRPASTRPIVAAASPPLQTHELARQQACADLVARNDPADKAGNLEFFAGSCREYTLPSRWSPPPPRRSLIARVASHASALLARVMVAPRVERISDCSSATASRADSLVCADPRLSAMDHRLAQSVARASDQVDDPEALQREQERWRGRVRNACSTAQCLQEAYGQRIAQLDALVPMRP